MSKSIINKTMCLALLASATSFAQAQDNFAFSGFPLSCGFTAGNVANVIVPGIATTGANYQLGSVSTINSASMVGLATNQWPNDGKVRLRNSAFPASTDFADVVIFTQQSAFTGTFSSAPGNTSGATSGTLVGQIIPAGSTWSAELFDSFDDSPTLAIDGNWTALNFTTNPPLTPVQSFNFVGPVASKDAAGTAGNDILTAAGPATALNFGNIQFSSGLWTRVTASTLPSDARIRVRYSSLPGLFADIQPSTSTTSVASLAVPFREFVTTSTGALLDKVIYPGGTWSFEFFENTQNGTAGIAEATWDNVNFGFTARGSLPTFAFSGTIAGPTPSIDAARDSSNAVVSLGTVGSSFILSSGIYFGGQSTRVHTSSTPLQAGVRLRNSAFPGEYVDFIPIATGSYPSPSFILGESRIVTTPGTALTADAASTLIGKTIPAGSTWTAEFCETTQDGAADIAESNWSGVTIGMQAGSALAAATPPSSTTLSLPLASTGFDLPAFAANTIQWYKVVLPVDIDGSIGNYLDIYTDAGTSDMTDGEIGLYNDLGQRLNNDDDDGAGNFSQISIGTNVPANNRPAVGTPASVVFDGRDRDFLKAGTYYVAVAVYNAAFGDNNYTVTTTGAAKTAGSKLFIKTNVPFNTTVSGNVTLQDWTIAPAGQVCDYQVIDSSSVVVSSGTVTLGAGGAYSFTTPQTSGTFTVSMKGTHWLNKANSGVVFTGGAATQNFSLINGDINDDNFVGFDDFDILSASFNLSLGDTGYEAGADLNGDDFVGFDDFDILSANFNTSGD